MDNIQALVLRRLGALGAMLALLLAICASPVKAAGPTLIIESWRIDDADMWDLIIADFNKAHPEITIKFQPSHPVEYDHLLDAKLNSGSAGDLITCRPLALYLDMFNKHQLADLTNLPGMENFSTFAKHMWSAPDDKTTYCVPMASVLHGFIYNKDYFDKNGFTEPQSYEDFLALLEKIKANGDIIPLALGVHDGWPETTMGMDNIGPNFWGGEAGVDGLLTGRRKYNDSGFVAAFNALSKWSPYLGQTFESESYTDSQNLFNSGKAAIFPGGSWEIAGFEKNASFQMGAFKAPPPAGARQCYISNQIDHALGLNAASKNQEAARVFLTYIASQHFETIYTQGLPGFFPLGKFNITLSDPLAATFLSWERQCDSSLRSSYQLPNPPGGKTNAEADLWNVNTLLLEGQMTAKQAGDKVQSDLDAWYRPAGAGPATRAATTQ